MNTVWQFATAGSIRFGRGARLELGNEIAKRQLSKPLLISDTTIVALPLVQELVSELSARFPDLTVFDQCVAEPAISVAEAAIQCAAGRSIDCVVGIGGGSNLDVAKVTATALRHGGHPSDYFGFDRIPGAVLPLFALPTTAGTGSEVSHSAVLTDESQAVKVSTLSRHLRPTCAIVDPALTDSCPAKVTADSGIDALVHAIEAYTNRDFSEMTDVDRDAKAYEGSYVLTRILAAEAIRLVGKSLVAAVDSPANEPARDDMALAATLAGMAFSNSGVGIVHALEYPIGAATHCGHGEGNGLLLPHVLRYNLPVRTPEIAAIGRMLDSSLETLPDRAAANRAIELIVELQDTIGIPTQLRMLGLSREEIPRCAAKTFEIKRLMDINAQPPTLASLEAILQEAF